MNAILQTKALTKRYRRQVAVDGLDLSIRPGSVFALLGRNGAGKTTTLRLMVGLLEPNKGSVEVFGRPLSKLGEAGRAQLGYVSENQELPGWMTVNQLLDFLRPLYPTWDEPFCQKLTALFSLPMDQKIRHLSRGMKMKAAFLSSLSYHPRLLILDEPFSGLDPLIREELIDALVDLTRQEEWTMILSSHDIDEVERLADEIGWLENGKLILREEVTSLQARFRQITARRNHHGGAGPVSESWMAVKVDDKSVSLVDSAFDPAVTPAQLEAAYGALSEIEIEPMSLRRIYIELLRSGRAAATLPAQMAVPV
jgi:ABC-2 type transport system ATP-binding protein